jgi:hypothetical protein
MNEQDPSASDDVRARLAAADPANRVAIEPITQHLMEHIMTTTTPSPQHTDNSTPTRPPRRWRRPAVLTGAASAAIAAVIGVATLGGGNSPVTAAPLELAGGGDAMAMCMQFSVDILADMPTAFEATATAVDGPTVTLDIDHWYRDSTGSNADSVVVNAPAGMEALIGGIAFEAGGHYLISASAEGNVSYCGYTGPATDELRASFDQAFPG